MVDGQDINDFFGGKPIDDPVASDDQLPNCLLLELRHNPHRPGKWFKLLRGLKNSLGKDLGRDRRVSSDEETNGVQVVESLLSPIYGSHLAIRARASSWLIVWPALT